jgi:acetyl-CoA synthetase
MSDVLATRAESPAVAAEWAAVEKLLDRDPHGSDFNTAHEACSRWARRPGPALTVVHGDGSRETWTYGDLDRAAARAARVLHDLGLRPGDAVAGLLARQVESWITALAAWRSGLVFVPLFGGFAADAVRLRVEVAGAKAVVCDQVYVNVLHDALATASIDPAVLVVGDAAAVPTWARSFHEVVDAAAPDGPVVPTLLDDTATILFTSGTTGTPKGCRMTHAAFVSTLPYVRHVLGTAGPVFSTADPAWAYGLLTTGASVMALGIPRVMYSGPFTPEQWYDVTDGTGAAVMATAPAALRRLSTLFGERGVPAALRQVAAAGEPLTETVARDWAATGAPVVRNGYGLSEVGMVLADLIGTEDLITPGYLTAEVPGFEALAVCRDGTPVEPGEQGLVAVHRPRFQMSSGYVNVPEQWDARWQDDLFLTEDRVERDEQGRWIIVGRDDDMIIVSGHNMGPVEIENAALVVPAVQEAAAVPFADPQRGDVLRVVVVPVPGATAGDVLADQVREAVVRGVGRYARPAVVDFVDALPRTEVGKLRRGALRSSA